MPRMKTRIHGIQNTPLQKRIPKNPTKGGFIDPSLEVHVTTLFSETWCVKSRRSTGKSLPPIEKAMVRGSEQGMRPLGPSLDWMLHTTSAGPWRIESPCKQEREEEG